MKGKILIHLFLLVILSTAIMLAQNNNSKKTVIEKSAKKETIKGNSKGNIKTPQSTGDEINFKNETDNSILTISDEGDNAASITLPPLSAIGSSSSKLYNLNGSLYWNGNALGFANGWTKSGNYVYLTDPANFVGIGTSSPAYNLDIRSSSVSSSVSLNLSNSDASHNLFFYSGKDGNPSPLISWHDGDDLRFAKYSSGTTELMRIMSNGNVGIGTNNPGAKLEVAGQVKITGGTPGDGKVLVSDANGLSSWNTFGINDLSDARDNLYSLFLGVGAGNADQGNQNIAVGIDALYSNTTGDNNLACGFYALYSNTTGDNNTANGYYSLTANNAGSNSAFGYLTLNQNTTGNYNTANGANALSSNTTGTYNTAVGNNSLSYNVTGSTNTAIGESAGPTSDHNNLSNTTALGAGASVFSSNQVRIGNFLVTSIGGYANWTNISDIRYKKNVKEDVIGLKFIMGLRPITYNLDVNALAEKLGEDRWIDKNGDEITKAELTEVKKASMRQSGFSAQAVETLAEKLGYDFGGVDKPENEDGLYGLRYAEFVVPLVKAVQEQQKIIVDAKETIKTQQQEIKELKEEVLKIEKELSTKVLADVSN